MRLPKIMPAIWLMLLCLSLLSRSTFAQTAQIDHLDLYILIGQSNMAGRGPITPDISNEHDDQVYMFTRDTHWVVAKHPLHFDKPKVAGVGPGLTFGIAMLKAGSPETKIGLVPCAVGGTAIETWTSGGYDKATGTHPYDDAVIRIKAAMRYGTVKGVIWHQGESNSSPEKAKAYLEQLTTLIQRIRQLTGNPKLPFVAGQLGRYRVNYANINSQLELLPQQVPFTAVASSEGLIHKGDTTHFDGHSAQEMGRRMAAEMILLQGSK